MSDVSVYFVRRSEIGDMIEASERGEKLASVLTETILHYMRGQSPKCTCAMCEGRMRGNVAFVVMLLDESRNSLTSVICENCVDRSDMDAQIQMVIHEWMPDMDVVRVMPLISSRTLH